jgi:hypothetical protein
MFKRLFFLSGIIAFVLACALMYFWYLPNHQTTVPSTTDIEEVTALESDSVDAIMPQ